MLSISILFIQGMKTFSEKKQMKDVIHFEELPQPLDKLNNSYYSIAQHFQYA